MTCLRMLRVSVLSWFCLFLLQLTEGTKIAFKANKHDVKEGLPTNLTLTCSLNDTASSGSIVGRSIVTQTTDNMAAISSLIVMKNGKDIASVSQAKPAHVMDGSVNTVVSGGFTSGVTGENGFLQITFQDPINNQIGEYVCEANAISDSGHIVTFSTSVEVTMSIPSTADLIAYIRQKDAEKAILERKMESMEKKQDDMQKKQDDMEKTISVLQTKGFFSVGLSKNLGVTTDQAIVFDHVFSNIGDAFDVNNGLFTCKIAGYYEFVITVANYAKNLYVSLTLNNKGIIAIWGPGGSGNREQGSNSVIVKLAKGDVVRVLAHGGSYFGNSPSDIYTTFSGNLLKVV